MSEPIEPGRIMPTYSGFVVLRINEIWAIWREGNPERALKLALRFADTLLIKKIKKALEPDVEFITKALNKANEVGGVDLMQRRRNRMLTAKRVASIHIGPFLSKLSDLLDEWGYYEAPSRRLKASDFKELEKVED